MRLLGNSLVHSTYMPLTSDTRDARNGAHQSRMRAAGSWGGLHTRMCVPHREKAQCAPTPLKQHSAGTFLEYSLALLAGTAE